MTGFATRFWRELRASHVARYLVTALAMGAVIAFVLLLRPVLIVPNAGVLYMLVVIASAYWLGTGPAVFGVLMSLGAVAYVYGPLDENLATFGVRFVIISVALVVGLLVARWARRQEERALAFAQQADAERARFEAVLEQMPSGVAIIEAPSGATILTNEQLVSMWRQRSAFASASEFGQLVGVSPDGRAYGAEDWPLVRSVRSGEIVTNEEVRFQRLDGTWGTQIISSAPVRDRDGNAVAAVAVVTEITERKAAEEERERLLKEIEVRASELAFERDRLRTVLSSIADAVFVCDSMGLITESNAAALALLGAPSAAIGRNLTDYLSALQLRYLDGRSVPLDELAITRALSGATERGREEIAIHPTPRGPRTRTLSGR
jgi:PAS domain-containing protein